MADLLECLIQIKGVADTPRRLAARVRACLAHGRGDQARQVAARLAAAEARFAACLGQMLAGGGETLPPLALSSLEVDASWTLADSLQEFGWRRQQAVEALDRCTARELGRVGIEPSRGPMTVADLVAVMLAHDTDQLGQLLPPAASPD